MIEEPTPIERGIELRAERAERVLHVRQRHVHDVRFARTRNRFRAWAAIEKWICVCKGCGQELKKLDPPRGLVARRPKQHCAECSRRCWHERALRAIRWARKSAKE